MDRFRLRVAVVGAVAASALVACSALIGIDQFHDVDCNTTDCGTGDAAGDAHDDALDAGDASDTAPPPDVQPPEGGPDALEIWAHWPMPNPPDASTLSEAGGTLPNPMDYDAGTSIVFDNVTRLQWQWPSDAGAADPNAAATACAALGPSWHVPTRIQLVSIMDYTQSPAFGAPFQAAGAKAVYWSSSIVFSDAATPTHWTVDFSDGRVRNDTDGARVICVDSSLVKL
jgi:hypothetical protein